MKRKTTISKTEKEPWSVSDKINSVLAFLTLIAVIGTIWSTSIANDALAMQREQTVKSEKQDNLNTISDSIKNERYMELTQQQIDALKEQVVALNRGIKNTEISQQPYFVILDFGFHLIDNDDKYLWSLKIRNYGDRPAFVKRTKLYAFDGNFKLTFKDTVTITTLAYKDFVVSHEIKPKLKGIEFNTLSKKDILTIDDHYIGIVISYYDPLLKRTFISDGDITAFKWKKKGESQLFKRKSGEDVYFHYDLCSDVEVSKIRTAIKNVQE